MRMHTGTYLSMHAHCMNITRMHTKICTSIMLRKTGTWRDFTLYLYCTRIIGVDEVYVHTPKNVACPHALCSYALLVHVDMGSTWHTSTVIPVKNRLRKLSRVPRCEAICLARSFFPPPAHGMHNYIAYCSMTCIDSVLCIMSTSV